MTKEEIRQWLLSYAWLGSPVEQAREVACILSQDGWRAIEVQAERYAGAQWEPGPQAVAEGTAWALSALYECHDGPHLPTCPRATNESADWWRRDHDELHTDPDSGAECAPNCPGYPQAPAGG